MGECGGSGADATRPPPPPAVNAVREGLAGAPEEARHRPWPSAHLGGFVLLWLQWATHSQASGVARGVRQREAASASLGALICSLGGNTWERRLFVDEGVEH